MAEPEYPRIEVSEARATLSSLITAINTEKVPRILTRYGRDVAIILPPGSYALVQATPVEEGTVAGLAQQSLTEAIPEP
jgi:PHD/YefM family antitoxin component YafN of YafNO toxin-antitoxin module